MTSLATLKTSLNWQRQVAATTKSPAQRARCEAAIERLTAQIKQQEET